MMNEDPISLMSSSGEIHRKYCLTFKNILCVQTLGDLAAADGRADHSAEGEQQD